MLYNFDNDTIQKKKLTISYYILSVSLRGDWTFQIILFLLIKKVALKCHKYFRHPTTEELPGLLKSVKMANYEWDKEILVASIQN